jgi:DNA modification methylase
VLVYRKHTEKLIDWNIRTHPDQDAVLRSKVGDDYERTNIWKISPAFSKDHPAIFPPELVERVIKYYSFEGDVVLDPFAGSGTLGRVATHLKRRFVLSEMDPDYIEVIRSGAQKWLGKEAAEVLCINCCPLSGDTTLF